MILLESAILGSKFSKDQSNIIEYHLKNSCFWVQIGFQEVYLRRRACEGLGCQGKDIGTLGAAALKRAAEDFSGWLLFVFLDFDHQLDSLTKKSSDMSSPMAAVPGGSGCFHPMACFPSVSAAPSRLAGRST